MSKDCKARLDAARAPWLGDGECRRLIEALSPDDTRVVGGAVRDALLGLPPPDDLDLATRLRPEETIARLEAAGFRVIPTGLAHGTVTAVGRSRRYEITTLRVDVETDGRHARVAFTDDWAADAHRRDFTINALYCDIDGCIHDHVGGLEDLAARRVRFIGDADARIREDALRILRFFRFYAWYGRGAPDREALAACRRHLDMLEVLSIERIRDELLKLLAAPNPTAALNAMAANGVLRRVLPAADENRLSLLPTLVARERLFASALAEDETSWRPLRRLAHLVALEAQAWRDEGRRLRLSRAQVSRLTALATPLGGHDGRALRRAIYARGFAAAANRAVIEAAALPEDEARALAARVSALSAWRPPRFPVTGRDLLALGLAPGPQVGRLHKRLEEAWLASDFTMSRAELLAQARRTIAENPALNTPPPQAR